MKTALDTYSICSFKKKGGELKGQKSVLQINKGEEFDLHF